MKTNPAAIANSFSATPCGGVYSTPTPPVLGKTLTIREQAYTIVGVMPRGFSFPFNDETQVWSPAEIPPPLERP